MNLSKDDLIDKIKLKYAINDRYDVCVKIGSRKNFKEFENNQTNRNSYYVYEPAYKSVQYEKIFQLNSTIDEKV